jgi:hypothetical protein
LVSGWEDASVLWLFTDGALESGVPKALFSVVGSSGFAATRDGNRFLVTMSDPSVDPWPITIVVNWPTGLKR